MRAPPLPPLPAATTGFSDLQPELMGEIHGRLSFLDRLAFAAASSAATRDAFKPEPPWLVIPGDTPGTATVFSLADRRSAAVRAWRPAMWYSVIIGSSGGWIVTADKRGWMRLANPVTGEHGDLPAITTIPFINATSPGGHHFIMDMESFVHIRYRGELESWMYPYDTVTHIAADDMWLSFYRKVVLSASPRPGDYAAMLLLDDYFGTPAFATAEDGRWRVVPSVDGVEDAIHHEGKFLSVTYTGIVEAWERDGVSGEFTSNVVTTRMSDGGDDHRKYLAAAPDGRLMIVLKNTKRMKQQNHFKVQVFDEMTQRWEAAEDIGELAILVGVNSSLCVSTAKHPEMNAGCVYYTNDDMWEASMRRDFWCSNRKPNVGAYSLKDGKEMSIPGLGDHLSWPPPAWFTPSFPR
uniref:KIB1-4 beta-propeller domain-containing protein n=1 Tax=Oryza glumipatula TaxID=40148 RepID=A0A0E0AXF5_9ORYZ